MTDEALYSMRVDSRTNNGQMRLLDVCGHRDTVIEMALRVMLDCAPAWDAQFRPMFTIETFKVK